MLVKFKEKNTTEKIRFITLCSLFLFFFIALILISAYDNYELSSIFIIHAYTSMILFLSVRIILDKDLIKKLIGISIFTILTSPFLVYSAVLFIRIMRPLPNSLPIVVADSRTWIQFAGSVVGGSMIMLSLFFTFQHEKSSKKEQRSIEIMPFI